MVLTDAVLAKVAEGIVRIHGQHYTVDLACKTFKVDDLVLDRKDGAYATVDSILNGMCALRDGHAVELCVPLTRLVKLVPHHG